MAHADPGVSLVRKVGDLACQRDSYLRSLRTRVHKCVPASEISQSKDWIKNAVPPPTGQAPPAHFCIQFEDTPLFAEGGGQPPDCGRVEGEVWVGNVQRVGMDVWHLTDKEIEEGREVDVVVDWERRWDHMQHHSAQHLLTAVVEEEAGQETVSWGLGKDMCYIQLNVNTLHADVIERIERRCNDAIREATPVEVRVIDDPAHIQDASSRSSRGIPKDIKGPIRLIGVKDIDSCTCCGTHVSTLGQLHLLRVLHFEPKGNTMRLFFVAGDRAIRQSKQMYDRERGIVKTLGTAADDAVTTIERLKKSANESKKLHAAALKEMAPLLGATLAAARKAEEQKPLFHHRDDADMMYLMAVADAVLAVHPHTLFVGTQGDRRQGGEGQMLLAGPEERATAAVKRAEELLQAKGGTSKGRWRGKVPSLKKLKEFEKAEL
eukprot:Hpha_TRINITY_DN25132_c0_g1::TRINITY_DN25132_c0_g1_i1::g.139315::m.139315/K07050/AARSD1, ALAX; misacylated tRNA(Ala) deacylase